MGSKIINNFNSDIIFQFFIKFLNFYNFNLIRYNSDCKRVKLNLMHDYSILFEFYQTLEIMF